MSVWKEDELTCKPIDSYSEIELFLQNPPSWRTLCNELEPHSKYMIKNCNLTKRYSRAYLEYGPDTFCHYDPDVEADVVRHEESRLPKTLLCHDMANGYHDDSIIDGTGRYDAYTFYNWAGIDIFCYFSHHLITIPPLGWINVGHAHGVKVIGTVITEWAEGVAFWDKVLQSEYEYKNFASALVAIAKTLKFDGWLLNVENKIAKVEILLEFVKHLHKTLHQELKNPVLIWYDSVTVEGTLNWQNALNHRNKAFFDACDGLFTNYSWTEELVQTSAEAAGAAGRLTDLFIGIDVWGRNFYGGGQFNVHQAVDVAYTHGCSLAIFAPAWSHEAMTMDKSDANAVAMAEELEQYGHFLLRDRALWDTLWRYLNTRVPNQLPFKTSFCRGQGKKRRLYGEVLCPVPWYNLRHMQYQPNSSHGPHGYILSTFDNILQISAIEKDIKGIIKYREAIQASRHELNPIKESEHVFDLKSDSLSHLREQPEPTIQDEAVQNESHHQQSSIKRKLKNIIRHMFKVKSPRKEEDGAPQSPTKEVQQENIEEDDALQQLGAVKATRDQTHDDKRKECAEGDDAGPSSPHNRDSRNLESSDPVEDESDSPYQTTSRSMVQVSVSINLGQTGKTSKRRFALACVPDERQCLQICFRDSFIGGSCLEVHPSDRLSTEHRFTRLFHCDFTCNDILVFCVVTKNVLGSEEQYLNIKLFLENANKQHHRITLIGRNIPSPGHVEQSSNVYPMNNRIDSSFRDLQKYLLLYEPGFYVPVENSYNWTVRYYQVRLPGARLTSINCRAGLDTGPILLGHLGVCQVATVNEDNVIG